MADPRPVRVAFLDHTARWSGGEIALHTLLEALEGVEPVLVLAEDGPLRERVQALGIPVQVLPLGDEVREVRKDDVRPGRLPLRPAVATAGYVVRLARRLRALRPDIVHTNSLKSALYGTLAARLAGVPVVVHVRDRIAADYLPGPAVRVLKPFLRTVPDALIANSQSTLAAVLDGEHLVHKSRRYVIPSATRVISDAVRSVEPTAGSPQRSSFRVGIIGRIAPWKGQDVFLDAFARAYPDGDERAVVVGSPMFGEDDYLAALRAQATRLGLDGRVEFTGFVEDVNGVLADLDVLVHASVTAEPFGQVVIEGLAAGVPVIAADDGGPAEILQDGVDGLLHPPGDAGALAERLVRLRSDPALRERLARAGVARARDFAPDRLAADVLEVYTAVLHRRGGR